MTPTPKEIMASHFSSCEGCGRPVMLGHNPCWECVKARARTVGNRGRCTCPKTLKRPREVSTSIRAWLACDRCLGTIKSLPDPPKKWRGYPRNGPGVIPRASSGPPCSWT